MTPTLEQQDALFHSLNQLLDFNTSPFQIPANWVDKGLQIFCQSLNYRYYQLLEAEIVDIITSYDENEPIVTKTVYLYPKGNKTPQKLFSIQFSMSDNQSQITFTDEFKKSNDLSRIINSFEDLSAQLQSFLKTYLSRILMYLS